jgi:hypothetical protein
MSVGRGGTKADLSVYVFGISMLWGICICMSKLELTSPSAQHDVLGSSTLVIQTPPDTADLPVSGPCIRLLFGMSTKFKNCLFEPAGWGHKVI